MNYEFNHSHHQPYYLRFQKFHGTYWSEIWAKSNTQSHAFEIRYILKNNEAIVIAFERPHKLT